MYLTEYGHQGHAMYQSVLLECAKTLADKPAREYLSFVCQSNQHNQHMFQVKDGRTSKCMVQISEKQMEGNKPKAQISIFVLLTLHDNGTSKEELETLKTSGLLFGVSMRVRQLNLGPY